MKNSNNLRILFSIIALFFAIISMFVFSLLSPYELWNVSIKQVDHDKLLVLHVYWIFISLFNIVFALVSKPNKIIFIIYLILFVLSTIKFITLCFVWFWKKHNKKVKLQKILVEKWGQLSCSPPVTISLIPNKWLPTQETLQEPFPGLS